jgi:hypothetical protein
MHMCSICHFATELDDVELAGPAGACVCLRCFRRETGNTHPMPKTLQRGLRALLAELEPA